MKKYFISKYIIGCLLLLGCTLGLASCDDDSNDWGTDGSKSQMFTPVIFETSRVSATAVDLSFTSVPNAKSYIVEYSKDSLEFTTIVGTVEFLADSLIVDSTSTSKRFLAPLKKLDGSTRYSARIKATSNIGLPDSKWGSVTFKTLSEQILFILGDEDLGTTQVTLRWPKGEQATSILLTPGDKSYAVTPENIAEGAITITGLGSETSYTAKLMKDDKVRGTREFKTLVDLGGAIAVNPEDDFAAILAGAKDGDAFALYPGKYGASTKFVVKANVEIKAVRPANKPILSGYISIEDGASLLLKDVVLDGTNNESNQAIIFNTADVTYGALVVDGCEIKNHDKGLTYLNKASVVESITINNCIISNIVCNGGDFIDSRAGAIKVITLSKSTVYNSCAGRDFIRYDDKSADYPAISPVVNITECTLVGVSGGSSNRLLYIRFKRNSINFSKNLVVSTNGIFTNQASTGVPTFGGNNYFNAPNLFSSGAKANFYDDSATKEDPQFKDAAEGNFTVGNIKVTVGDPRWIP